MKRYLLGTALLIGSAIQAQSATYSFDIVQSTEGFGGGGNANLTSMDNQGTVIERFIFRDPPNGSASDNRTTLRTIDILGNRTIVAPIQTSPEGVFQFREPIINDAGQKLVVSSRQTFLGEVLEIVNLDGSRKSIAIRGQNLPPSNTIPEFQSFQVLGGGFNDTGDVAAIVRTLENEEQIVRINGSTGDVEFIASPDDNTFSFSAPVINNFGEVAWIAQIANGANGLTRGVYTSTGANAPERRLGIFSNGGSGLGPALNDKGNVLGYQPGGISFGEPGGNPDAAGQVIAQDSDLQGFVDALGLNDFDQKAYSDQRGIVVDGQRVITIGDTLAGTRGTVTSATFRGNSGFNNNGQILAAVNTEYTDELGNPQRGYYSIRINPEGASPDNPLLPISSTEDGQNEVLLNITNGLGVDAPIWVDPIVATGFTYAQGLGGANFATLIIPEALPLGDDDFTLEFLAGGSLFSRQLSSGISFDFTIFDPLGISQFTIKDIDVAEAIDPTDPFVVGLTFTSGGFQSSLSIDAITVNTDPGPTVSAVPIPPSIILFMSALFGLGFTRKGLGFANATKN